MMRRRLVLVTVLLAVGALLVSSCDWAQSRYGPDATGFNPFEKTIGAVECRQPAATLVRTVEGSRYRPRSWPTASCTPCRETGRVRRRHRDGEVVLFDHERRVFAGSRRWRGL